MDFIILFRANEVASLQILGMGSEGAKEQRRVIRDYGGRVKTQVAVLGRFDLVLLAEFPSANDCLAYCLAANASGNYAEALPAFTPGEVDSARTKAQEVTSKLIARAGRATRSSRSATGDGNGG